jgi:phage repressor protein C with HTH and peptisase S24 domain
MSTRALNRFQFMPVPHTSQARIDPDRFADALAVQMRERGVSQYGLADLIGVTQATVSAWLNRRRLPSPDSANAALNALGIRWDEVAASPATSSSDGAGESGSVSSPDVVLIPRNGRAAAASSATTGVVNSNEATEHDAYPRSELIRITGANPDRLRSLTVIGDSLAPEIPPNTRVIYLPMEAFGGDGLYVLEIDEAAIVKRVQHLPGGTLRIKPINPDYDMVELRPLKEADTANTYRVAETGETSVVRVVGKVVFYPKPA